MLYALWILHDTIEDTSSSYGDIKNEFGIEVADGVLALSKDKTLPSKQEQMIDSIHRIKVQPKEVWMVKLCDRITNLQPPPNSWDKTKITNYRDEAILINTELGSASKFLSDRLKTKMLGYDQYI